MHKPNQGLALFPSMYKPTQDPTQTSSLIRNPGTNSIKFLIALLGGLFPSANPKQLLGTWSLKIQPPHVRCPESPERSVCNSSRNIPYWWRLTDDINLPRIQASPSCTMTTTKLSPLFVCVQRGSLPRRGKQSSVLHLLWYYFQFGCLQTQRL